MKKRENNFFNRVKIKNFQEIQFFKQEFEKGRIEESKIPDQYRKYIRKIYIQQIQEFRQILKNID